MLITPWFGTKLIVDLSGNPKFLTITSVMSDPY